MSLTWGLVLVVLSLLCWVGQLVSWIAPVHAAKLGLVEAERDVEPLYWADIRGEALWDSLTLWTMIVAGVLLIIGHETWSQFGLVGGGMYFYFAGRGVLTRLEMTRRGHQIGAPRSVRIGYLFLTIWAVMAAITVIAASVALSR